MDKYELLDYMQEYISDETLLKEFTYYASSRYLNEFLLSVANDYDISVPPKFRQ